MTDFAAITQRQQQAWSLGDFGRVAAMMPALHSELLCAALDLHAGERVLDVAAGNGNASLAAARRFCRVVSTDYVPDLVAQTAARATTEGLELDTQVADAQHLPFADGQFDVTLSTFGVMFAPDQQRAADELTRVTRSGGRIGMNNWVPDSLVGDMFRTLGARLPPPPGVRPAFEWGTKDRLRELFGDRITALRTTRQLCPFRYPSTAFLLDYFRTWNGPTRNAFNALDDSGQAALTADLLKAFDTHNFATDATYAGDSAYLEIVAVVA